MYRRIINRTKRMTRQERWYMTGAVVVCLMLLSYTVYTHTPRAGTVPFTKEYETTLVDYEGHTVRFESLKYKPLVVFFWATWCPYCKDEMLHLAALKQQYGNAVEIAAVNRKESIGDAKAFTDPLPLPTDMLLLLDQNDALFKELGGYAMPETIFINNRGEQVVHQHGPIQQAEIDASLQKILE